MWNKYYCVSSVEDALNILVENPGKSKLIAGGTDILLELEKGIHPKNEILVDISRVEGLDLIIRDEENLIHIGPMVTHNHCVNSNVIQQYAPLLAEACYSVGSPQIRNRGTVVGNLVTASPANDTISPLMALDAVLTLRSNKGERRVPLSEFYKGVRRTVLELGELITEISFKGLTENEKGTFTKYALRKAQAISLVNASMILKMDEARVTAASITLGAVSPIIIHAIKAEKSLIGKELTAEAINNAAELVKEDVSPISDIRSSADYRSLIASVIVRRGLEKLSSSKNQHTVPEHPVVLWGKTTPNQKKLSVSKEIEEDRTDIHTIINGKEYCFDTGQHKSLLHLLREEAGLVGTKEGCGEGECGACTVYLDGVAVMSCLVPAPRADGAEITTIEGISGGNKLHPVQEEFISEGAVQCGYCTPGFVMSAVKLFEEKQTPNIDEIKMAITGNLCRCTGYYKIVKAIENVAERSG
jgi:carbon-monoxide dehydrogenase medium subunit